MNVSKLPSKVVVVLGSGRSGTSLVTNLLEGFGMTTSTTMTLESEQNPDGTFEDLHIFSTQDGLIKELAGSPYLPMPKNWESDPATAIGIKQLRGYLLEQISQADTIFGFKDPRTAFLLPMWSKIFNLEKITPYYICAVREPAAVCTSLKKNYNRNLSTAEIFWLTKHIDIFRHTGGNVFISHYEDWFTDNAEDMAHGLLAYTGLDASFDGNIEELLASTIKPHLNRSQWEKYEVKNRWVNKLYDVLKECRGTDFDRSPLMKTVQECSKAMDEFMGWPIVAQQILQDKAKRISSLEKKIRTLKGEVEQNTAMQRQLQSRMDDIQALKAKLNEIKNNRNELQTQLVDETAKRQQLEKELEAELDEIKNNRNELQTQLVDETAKHQQLEKELEQIVLQNNEYLKEIKILDDEIENLHICLKSRSSGSPKTKANKNKQKAKQPVQHKNKPVSKTKDLSRQINKLEREIFDLHTSYSFRIGQTFVNAVAKPGKNTIMLPFRFIGLVFEFMFMRKNK